MELILLTILAIAFITAIFLTWFFIHKSKQEERQLLIEKGVDLSELPERGILNFNFPWLKIGCVLTIGSIGLLIGVILQDTIVKGGGEPLLGMLIFGGIGMIAAHFIGNRN
ncbi:MAG: DUF6249 domain-containing protein [Balneolaceae bacterium]|nr:DUF6249 domain-containing protein [Balneolaceae bacterium]